MSKKLTMEDVRKIFNSKKDKSQSQKPMAYRIVNGGDFRLRLCVGKVLDIDVTTGVNKKGDTWKLHKILIKNDIGTHTIRTFEEDVVKLISDLGNPVVFSVETKFEEDKYYELTNLDIVSEDPPKDPVNLNNLLDTLFDFDDNSTVVAKVDEKEVRKKADDVLNSIKKRAVAS